MNNNCCEALNILLHEPMAPIKYYPEIRSYHLAIPDMFLGKNEICVSFKITHCPRCGTKFPESLADRRCKILSREYGLNDLCDLKQKKLIPKEFKTDEWWQKRGL
jgi:hypothetical protein